jgi:hypothetical protein
MRIRVVFGFCLTVLFSVSVFAQARVYPEGVRKDNVLYVNLPTDLSRQNVEFADEVIKGRLHKLAAQLARREPAASDLIVMFVDRDGQMILPNRELVRSRRGFGDASTANLAAAAAAALPNRLIFTFNSPVYPWTTAEVQTLSSAVNTFYPVISQVYGDPAFDNTVNLSKDPNAPAVGLYYPAFNEVVIKTLDYGMDVLCHELIHAFRDDNISWLDMYEEGMTRAAEVEVANRIPSLVHWDENHSYEYDVFYEGMNKTKIGSTGGDFFTGYISPLLRYQLAGYAWGKPLIVNGNFLRDFNSRYYAMLLQDPSVAGSASALLDIAAAVQLNVEGSAFRTWYAKQSIFQTAPPQGYSIFQRFQSYLGTVVDYFDRESTGWETMMSNSLVKWVVSDFQGITLSRGSGTTSASGWVAFTPAVPTGYTGRIKVVVSVNSPAGTIKDTAFRYVGMESGVFGIVKNGSFGLLTITAKDGSIPPVTVNVTNGGFFIPSLAAVRGEFSAVFQNSGGAVSSKQFIKDASNYFLSID